jgi:ribonuclease Z
MLRVTFLGTGGTLPTPSRNPSAIAVNREGELILFDCGEGTQQQMMRAKTGMKNLTSIFLTHFHADHFLGIPGLLQTMSFQGRSGKLEIFGPKGVKALVSLLLSLGHFKMEFDVVARELEPDDEVRRKGYRIKAVKTSHGVLSMGYVLEEDPRKGRFDREKAISLGVPVGPLFSRLHSGKSVFIHGREVKPEEVVGPPRPGRKIVYTGDTRPCESIVEAAKDADLLIHDGALSEELKEWALESMHSTAYEAAFIAKRASVSRLILTHISSRYADDATPLLEEARKIFKNTYIAEELMAVDVPYRD